MYYLYDVNKQAGYITTAYLLLAIGISGFLFLSLVTKSPVQPSIATSGDVNKDETSISAQASPGRILFLSKCAACHSVLKDLTGPALAGFEQRGEWSDRKRLYQWIRNPEAFMKTDLYTQQLKKQFGSIMTAFPGLTDEEIDSIAEYIN